MSSLLSGLVPAKVDKPEEQEKYRDFDDITTTRKAIYDSVLAELQKLEPVSNQRYSLSLTDVGYIDPEDYPLAEQKKALLEGRTLARRIRGTWTLKDTEGNVVSAVPKTVAQVPYYASSGGFIINGTKWSLANQMRLRPGVFTRQKDNGELESHINVMPGKGVSHRYYLEPETGVFKINLAQGSVPLYPLLRAVGISDDELKDAWGRDLLAANQAKNDPQALQRLYAKVLKKPKEGLTEPERQAALANFFHSMELDPEVTQRTLGQPFTQLSREAMLATTKKLLAVSRGETDTDDRDDLVYQTVLGPEELISERVRRSKQLLNQLLWKSAYKGNVEHIQSGAMTKLLQSALMDSGLGITGEEVNPAELYDQMSRITRLGYGGIPSLDSVPKDARSVQPSHTNYVDLVRTPECADWLTEVMTADGWKFWPDVTADDKLACLVDGKLEFHQPIRLIASDYQGKLLGFNGGGIDYLVTPNHRMYIRRETSDNTGFDFVLAEELHNQACDFVVRVGCEHPTNCEVVADGFYEIAYDGKVYCAEVPGGLLYTRRNNGTGFWNGNSLKAGVDLRLTSRVRKGTNGRVYAPFIDRATGEEVWKTPQELSKYVIAFPGEVESGEPYVYAKFQNKEGYVPREKVQLTMPPFEGAFNGLANLIPFKSASKGQRVAMGSRMLTQALPLTQPEAPLVQTGMPGRDNYSYEDHFGELMGAVKAKQQPGRVEKVSPDGVTVRYADGTTETHELYHWFPNNRKTFRHNTPVVSEGDIVQPGQLLARSNYTDEKGTTALGLNARTAYTSIKGLNHEDAIVISESFAKKASSEHLYQHSTEWDKGMRRGKKNFISIFPAKYDRKTLANFDDEGVIKPGTVVNYGDPLVLIAQERPKSYKQLHSSHGGSFADKTVVWDHHTPGVVTDSVLTKKGATVAVRSVMPMQTGDKLCYTDDHEILTKTGWKPVTQVSLNDYCASLNPKTLQIEYIQPEDILNFPHKGKLYQLEMGNVSLAVTPNHNLFANIAGNKKNTFELVPAEQCYGKRYQLLNRARWSGKDPRNIKLGGYTRKKENGKFETSSGYLMPTRIYAVLLGLFYRQERVLFTGFDHKFELRGLRRDTQEHLLGILKEAHIPFQPQKKSVVVHHEPIANALVDLRSHVDRLPKDLFGWSQETCRVFLSWMFDLVGDERPQMKYSTSVKELADDIQRLALHAGMAAKILTHTPDGWKKPGRYDVVLLPQDKPITVNHNTLPKHQHEAWVDFDGRVYCVSLPENHILYVRRNGKAVWCGNSNRYGGKGVVHVLPDDDMPVLGDGKPAEVVLSPLGVISRSNVSQVIETVLGKIAAKTGKPYKTVDFDPNRPDLIEWAMKEAEKHGVQDLEDITDPETGQKVPNVLTGMQYFLKLHHQAEHKGQGRGLGSYSSEGAPARGGYEGAKSKQLALMSTNALLAHSATSVLRDAKLIRGQKNQEYWATFMSGNNPPSPKVPRVYEKFISQLRAAGVNVVRKGSQSNILAMTDADVDELAGDRELQNAETVDWKDGTKPIRGGLFDVGLTGGHEGNRFAKITLHEPMPSPIMEEPIRRLLRLTSNQFEDVIAGKMPLNEKTGPQAVVDALKRVNVDREIEQAKVEIRNGKRSSRDAAVKKLAYLSAAKQAGVHPSQWMLTKVPVLPPIFRPVSQMAGSGGQLVADANYLYKELFDANQGLQQMSAVADDLKDERLALYKSLKAVVGLGDPIQPKNVERGVKGMLKQIFGNNPKTGTVQSKLLATPMDLVGRGVIIPDPNLTLDEIGIPEQQAWEVYGPFVIRRLVRRGYSRTDAMRQLKEKSKVARDALLGELDERPVIASRAPVLHKYGELGFFPKLVKGSTIKIPPIVIKGLGADFDGDTMNFYVPADEQAKEEVIAKMLPSKNLYSVSKFKPDMYLPGQEYLSGLYEATTKKSKDKPQRVFQTRRDALAALSRGEISVDQPILIAEGE